MRKFLYAAVAAAVFAFPAYAQQGYPERPISLIVPQQAGATTDVVARLLANDLTERLGQPVVVENRPGGSGVVGMSAVANAAPDGYTIGLGTTTTQAVAHTLSINPVYDPENDFTPVAMVGVVPYVLALYPGVGVTTFEDLLEIARENPGDLNYGTVGEASLANLAMQLLADLYGLELTHVPYNSAAQVALDTVAGRVDMQLSNYGALQAFLQDGQLIPVAVSSQQRLDTLPDTPTITEAGAVDYEAELWFSIVAPTGLPDEIVSRLNEAVNASLVSSQIVAALEQQGVIPSPGTPEDLQDKVSAEIEKWRGVIESAGIEPQ